MAERRRRGRRPPRLCLSLIARDEAAFLDACLSSVAGLVDEIVVVDTGSADATPAVARQHGARVYPYPWADDFAAARNHGLERVTSEWVLVLDCDEVLQSDDHARLRSLMTAGADAYRLTTRNYTDERNRAGWVAATAAEAAIAHGCAGWFPSTKVRLWRHQAAVRFVGAVHELVEPSLARAGARLADCLVPVHHYGYAGKRRDPALYLRAGERKAAQAPNDPRAWFELALARRDADDLVGALAASQRVLAALDRGVGADALYLDAALAQVVHADLQTRLGRLDEAVATYRALLASHPDSVEAWNNYGLLLERLGRPAAARSRYLRGLELAPEHPVLAANLDRVAASRATLSACLIARDEAAVLGRCLASIDAVADEIVLVDTGSRDDTVDIARRFGARVGHFTWCDDFAAARNASLELATGTWIVWLDADDYLLPEGADRLRELTQLPADQAFSCLLVNEGADRSTFRQVKLFPNRPELRFTRPVHETLVPALSRLGIPVRAADWQVRHTGYADPEVTARKLRYYLQLMQRWVLHSPDDWELRFRVGHSLYAAGQFEAARRELGGLLTAAQTDPGAAAVAGLAQVFLGRSWLEQGQPEQALAHLEAAVRCRPQDALAQLSFGDACTKLGRYELAVPALRAALSGGPEPTLPLDTAVLGYSARFFLGQALAAQGQMAAAAACWQEASRLAPDRPEATAALAALGPSMPARGGPVTPATVGAEAGSLRAAMGADSAVPPRLSLCMIVRDEAARLPHCLDSVRGVVDEIVVVDTGSTDDTVAIAARYGARIGHFAWCDDFAAARNASLALATGDWVLWLDADDLLPAEDHSRVRELLNGGPDRAYFFVLDDHGYENVSCLQLRLFPRLAGVAFEMPIHEQVTPSLARLGVQLVPTPVRVVHTGYSSPAVVQAKKERYLAIMERWLVDHPGDYIVRSHVALTYHSTGRLAEAAVAYRRILDDGACQRDRNYIVYTTALLFLARTLMRQGQLAEALAYARQAEAVDPDYPLTHVSLAEIHLRLGQAQEALAAARTVLSAPVRLTFFPIDQRELAFAAHLVCGQALAALDDPVAAEAAFRQAAAVPVARRSQALGALAEMLRSRGDNGRALEVLRDAIGMDPANRQHRFNLGSLHLAQGDLDAAASCFESVLADDPASQPARLNLGYIARRQGRLAEAEARYQEAIDLAPEATEARANLAHLLLDQGRDSEAAAHFQAVRDRQPGLADIDLGLLLALARTGPWEVVRPLLAEVLAAFPAVAQAPGDSAAPPAAARAMVRLAAHLLRQQVRCGELAMAVAVALDPAYRDARRGLGEILLTGGALWAAVAQFEALIAGDPADRAAFQRLGDCYHRLGAEEPARLCWARAAGEAPTGPH